MTETARTHPQEASQMVEGITIDSSTTKDRDDAIWVERSDAGFRVTVCIADVASKVPKGSRFDVGTEEHRGAYQRIETKYHATGNVPMLPRFLSERKCSLGPGQKRDVMALSITLNDTLDATGSDLSFESFKSKAALAYTDVPEILADESSPWHDQITLAAGLAQNLLQRRRADGALVIYDLNRGWATNEDGVLVRLEHDEATVGYIIIQELMILANRELAKLCALREIPILYRNHTAKTAAPERDEIMRQITEAMGQSLGVIDALRQRTNMVFNKADYGPTLTGHYGLNLPAYMHSTSPIRRYADLVNQRQVRAATKGEELPYTQEELAEVAEYINATLLQRKKATSDYLRNRDVQRMERKLSATGELHRLTPKEFDRAIKVAVRSDEPPPEGFETVYETRLGRGQVGLLGQSWVLLAAPESWDGLKQITIDHLRENAPHDAPSIFGIAQNVHGVLPPKMRTKSSGADHTPVFRVSASTRQEGVKIIGPEVVHSSKKKATQLAAVALLASLAGVETPQATEEVERAPDPPKRSVPPPEAGTANPIGALNEHCQKLGAALPAYEVKTVGGPSHSPVFECVVSALGQTVSEKGSSKKDARRAAASALIAALRSPA